MTQDITKKVELDINDTTGAIKQFFRSLYKWQVALVAVIALSLVFTIGYTVVGTTKPVPKPLTPRQIAWKAWNKEFRPAYSKALNDYTKLAATLSNNSANTKEFNNLSADAIALAGLPASPSTNVNTQVTTLATDLEQLSSDGIAVYAGGGSIASFQNDFGVTDAQLLATLKASRLRK